jgi:hypothetical protein
VFPTVIIGAIVYDEWEGCCFRISRYTRTVEGTFNDDENLDCDCRDFIIVG